MSYPFYLGCAVWSYKGWLGEFYPPGTPSSQFLSLYSRCFPTVECNSTFYAVPSAATIRHWSRQTPPDFRFCPKFPRDITHQGLLVPKIATAQKFLAQIQDFGVDAPAFESRLGCSFLQLPPQYDSSYFPDLQEFLRVWRDTQTSLALEVRHPSWFTSPHAEKLDRLLQETKISRVILDTRPIYTNPHVPRQECRKPDLPVHFTPTASHILVRFISHPDTLSNQPYLEEWVHYLSLWLSEGKTIYFFMHCPQEEYSIRNAFYLQQLLEKAGIPVPSLLPPKDVSPKYVQPQQLELFS